MRCENWPVSGHCKNTATVWIIDPDKATVPGCRYCNACADETVRQYRVLLDEEWGTIPIDEHGYPKGE